MSNPTSATPYRSMDSEEKKTSGHPLGLYALFMTEMWERFSYYGMRALLVLYLVDYHGFRPKDSSSVYKWYTSLVYLTPLLGGFLADRLLGLRWAIIVGGILMAVGHFLMAFEPLPIFYVALAFLIAGNGFFKPNISTMVGRMYDKVDPRRDGAFTIFYMGINLGAGLAPIVCGGLRQKYGFHAGFTAAGVGMAIGLLVFLLFQKRIVADVRAAGNSPDRMEKATEQKNPTVAESGAATAATEPVEKTDDEKPGATGIAGLLAKVFPVLMVAVGIVLPIRNLASLIFQDAVGPVAPITFKDIFMPTAFALISLAMGLVLLLRIRGAARDKSTVIFVLFSFVVLFWMAFEQAGNTLNLWAEYFTDRKISGGAYQSIWMIAYAAGGASIISIFLPPLRKWGAEKGYLPKKLQNLPPVLELGLIFGLIVVLRIPSLISAMASGAIEYSAEEWQSANAFLIVIMAPMFAAFWIWLARKGREPSTPAKMGIAMVFVALSFVAMVGAAVFEGKATSAVALRKEALPKNIKALDGGKLMPEGAKEVLNAGRLQFDAAKGELVATGVLAPYVVNEALKLDYSREELDALNRFAEETSTLTSESPADKTVKSTGPASAFRPLFPAGGRSAKGMTKELSELGIECGEPETCATVRATKKLDAPGRLKLIAAFASKEWREALTALQEKTRPARVAGFWLFLSYFLATIGELCLSPVGLSMVTKLAPAKFASLFMGVWLLGSSVAQYAGGSIGEFWGDVTPTTYFNIFVASSLVGAVVLFLLVFPLRRLMHGVK